MCGINGMIRFKGDGVDASAIESMNACIRHRGPDDTGVFVEGGVGLGQNRLSILDLSPLGHQPMEYVHHGRRVVITFNGEIYNFREIRSQLAVKGYAFQSESDTEVLLAAYIEWGEECLDRLNGMFAFVIYDPARQKLFGARDRLGQKPLKYYLDDEKFLFSSELKAILACGVERELDMEAVDDFLSLQYVPSPKTGFRNIAKLPSGHAFVLDLKTRAFTLRRYFHLEFRDKRQEPLPQLEQELLHRLRAAVKRQLVSDVPLGAFLSGGVDSSAIVALMSEVSQNVKTFTIAFDQGESGEAEAARRVAERFGTEHREFVMDGSDLLRLIPRVIEQAEEPFADASILPTYLLSERTREFVTVALSGDAGDENFGGYDRHQKHLLLLKFGWILRLFIWTQPILYALARITHRHEFEKLAESFATLRMSMGRRHYNFTNFFSERAKRTFYRDEVREKLERRINVFENYLQEEKLLDPMDQVYYLDFISYLPDDINAKVDIASMQHALEVRAPLLDHELVQFTSRLPRTFKTSLFSGKKIFRSALQAILPAALLVGRKKDLILRKHGFSPPIKQWFRTCLRDELHRVVLDEQGLVLKLMKRERVEELLKRHMQTDVSKKLWALLVLNLWYKDYFLTNTNSSHPVGTTAGSSRSR